MFRKLLSNLSSIGNFDINLSLNIERPTRKQHLEQKFLKKVQSRKPKTLAEHIQIALETLSHDDFVIISLPGIPHGFIQYCKKSEEIFFDYPIVARTWQHRHLFWRYRYILEAHGFKPYQYHKTGIRFTFDKHLEYLHEETSTTRIIQATVTAEHGGLIGSDCFRIGLGVTKTEQVEFNFESWKGWWQWV